MPDLEGAVAGSGRFGHCLYADFSIVAGALHRSDSDYPLWRWERAFGRQGLEELGQAYSRKYQAAWATDNRINDGRVWQQ